MEEQDTLKSTPKDVFLHLFGIVTFYLSIVSFINLYIQYIDFLYPDALTFYYNSIAQAVRIFTSMLIIAWPFYLLTTWILAKDVKTNKAKREIKIRKWLLYLTLFVSAVTIIVDLIMFVYRFLDGDLSIKFFFKVLVVLVVAGLVFSYYLWDLKKEEANKKLNLIFTWVTAILVLASVILGFFIIGTPTKQRAYRFDEQRIQNLQTIQDQVVNYWQQKQVLPTELSALEDSISGFKVPADPDTKAIYEYKIISPLAFDLCANFKTVSNNQNNLKNGAMYEVPSGDFQQNWTHQAERTCFSRTIDPQLYQPVLKQ
ncbi:MAG: hypothetical protein UR94_C0008G0003 [Parcubacteria group bacterium GW2011_GWA2_36_10]|nr:MAG: hypothetical protein UR94_C0008G0003 [Parcubacteria group bacterium GW2011_GWA2_36_10]